VPEVTLAGLALAPAKINLGLEITGKRSDGYHNISTIMQTVSMFDRIRMTAPGSGIVVTRGETVESEVNLVSIAAREMARAFSRELDLNFQVDKRIPLSSGLGGGSSDAASAIRLIAGYWQIPADHAALHDIALETGSDVPYFLTSGRALVEGRGDLIRALPPLESFWVVIIVPETTIPSKTGTLYGSLRAVDFSDGSRLRSQPQSSSVPDGLLPNAFSRPMAELLPAMQEIQSLAGRPQVMAHGLSGAGPGYFMIVRDLAAAVRLAWRVRSMETLQGSVVRIAKTISGPAPLRLAGNITEH
jgi:4-diphosphocytidyl-2-C-methyl-D-erythritol kinase